ncbi:hypothetical protein WJX73_007380 [Symbiochloris irregularis]|uniref:Rieske domain-containing protein n=1 Tax=Symbiochloris irregularis TaxID=706552 RepID=A0AAW1NPU1_9CHLO
MQAGLQVSGQRLSPKLSSVTPSSVSRAHVSRNRRLTQEHTPLHPAELRQTASLKATLVEEALAAREELVQDKSTAEKFSWTKAWYPMQSIKDMDPKKPEAVKLFGKELVLWRDGNGTWRALEDLCPHRLVPLSEGRIEESNGTLMCSFHGWTFDGEGNCVNIPQCGNVDPAAEKAACSNKRSRVASFPTQEKQGLLWVWGESGPTAFIEAFATPVKANPLVEKWPEGQYSYLFDNYVRDVPGTIDVWIDNMTDQSHAIFAHNGAIGPPSKDLLSKGGLRGQPATVGKEPGDGIRYQWGRGDDKGSPISTGNFVYTPPTFNGLPSGGTPEDAPRSLWIYTTPMGANSTRLIINFARRTDQAPAFKPKWQDALKKKLFGFIVNSRWMGHLNLHNVDDGDQVLLHKQSSNYRYMKDSWQKATYSPATTDRGSLGFRKWWESFGGHGPEYLDTETAIPDPRPATDPNRRRDLLDRYAQHTHMCTACSGALKNVRLLQQVGKYAAIAAAAVLVIALGRGQQIVSPITAALTAFTAAVLYARKRLHKLEQRFVFTDWRHAEIA